MESKEQYLERTSKGNIQIGDAFYIDFNKEGEWSNPDKIITCIVDEIQNDTFFLKGYYHKKVYPIQRDFLIKQKVCSKFVGANPFEEEINFQFYSQDISIIESSFFRDDEDKFTGINFNPFIVLPNGEKFFYQRDYIWTLEDKQNLIDSIYRRVELGRIVVRKLTLDFHKKYKGEINNLKLQDLVDGKQRCLTIHSFMNDEFKDKNGNLYSELSDESKYQFRQTRMNVTTLTESCSDQSVLLMFLRSNISGVPQDTKHLELISEKLKMF